MSTVIVARTKEEVDQEIQAMDRASKRITRTKASAKAFLVKHGFITKGGKPTKRYR
mgnify:CR=1 FL=1